LVASEHQNQRILLKITGTKAKIEARFDLSHSIAIDCELQGDIEAGKNVLIEKNGVVEANIVTTNAEIWGQYFGNIKGRGKIEIKPSGLVKGRIKTDCLAIGEGAVFEGSVKRISRDDRLGERK